jgi:hypothetical protein
MQSEKRTLIVQDIMMEFAERTGVPTSAGQKPRRYLWTDAFAVCNFLELHRQTRDTKFLDLVRALIDQVHWVLGRHREDDPRSGWISGLGEEEGRALPTLGGLRIGKKMNERRPSDPYNENLEWDRDGQYYHYLTKWMHALSRTGIVTGDLACTRWAIELAKTTHAKFTYTPSFGGRKRMYWKMSIDLSYPLVPSMGHHDPLDGLITYYELQAGWAEHFKGSANLDLSSEIEDLTSICMEKDWTTHDPLGIGGLLSDAYKVAQMIVRGSFRETDLLMSLLEASKAGLDQYVRSDSLNYPAHYRLAFRELGLTIGLHAVQKMQQLIEREVDVFDRDKPLLRLVETLLQYEPIIEIAENFWLERANREVDSFTEHREINMVMLACSLAPDGYLAL